MVRSSLLHREGILPTDTLISFGTLAVFLLADLLRLAERFPIFHLVTLLVAFLCLYAAAKSGGMAISPPRLEVGRRGVTLSKSEQSVHFPWSQVAEVRILKVPPAQHKGWLVLWQVDGASQPPDHLYLTEWRPDLHAVRLIDLLYLGVPAKAVADAFRACGGERWNDSPHPR
ncbi:hypothetical protein [Actinomadura bangladeshensis]|uniref:PH domain-containing protein n=1 Tax=Actinomadura bangladeshensis TaxID=453573 RepID=A0A4R4NN28_9ACTN|nr:hypothetical protein [Actinomadura bangladeshensis]TDC09087.1 hypothetical protein E1284_30080 [Actinomadura bangladeshensis]